jgi:hypothetical protein
MHCATWRCGKPPRYPLGGKYNCAERRPTAVIFSVEQVSLRNLYRSLADVFEPWRTLSREKRPIHQVWPPLHLVDHDQIPKVLDGKIGITQSRP